MPDGSRRIWTDDEPPLSEGVFRLGVVEQESVLYKYGYVICPWFGRSAFNRSSINFMIKLANNLNCVFYNPGDGLFMNVPDLLRWVEQQLTLLADFHE